MSTYLIPAELLPLLPIEDATVEIHQLSGGLIHRTYRIKNASGNLLLQSINTQVFSDPEGLIHNHRVLHQHFQAPSAPFQLASPLPFSQGQWTIQDHTGSYWRLSQFITDTHTLDAVDGPAQAEILAGFFARFTRYAATLQEPNWSIPIPKFHDLSHRFQQFQTALSTGLPDRINASQSLIDALIHRSGYVDFFEQLQNNPAYPLRMMHHDAKLSNVLIDSKNGQWVCPIDLDTVMPGYYFSDLGDMIRSLCNSQKEDEVADDQPILRTDIYQALVRGYLSGMGDALTPAEITNIHQAGPIMIYMQAIRFLTDHLNGDTYYRIDRPGHNFDRAQNQFNLLNQLEIYRKQIPT